MGTGHTWSAAVIPSTTWTPKTTAAFVYSRLAESVRKFVVWDPYVSNPVSTVWDAGATTWVE